MNAPVRTVARCAIYTRKSTEQGLEQDFNSLDAQREACEAYVRSQAHEGWQLLPQHYADGGFSGGSTDRPGLQELLAAIREGRVDIVVVYKVDRLTRSLADFAKLVELFDARGVSFVSVTQSFNTTTSMGRLTLNVLLSFAQFEREVTAERIRDKIAASKRKGMRMGGPVPLGYEVRDKKLVVHAQEAGQVDHMFRRYLELGCLTALAAELRERGMVTKVSARRDGSIRGGIPFGKGSLAYLLHNRAYVGEVIHKGRHFEGQHEAIIDRDLFDQVQARLAARARRSGPTVFNAGSLLKGVLFDDRGNRMTPATSRRRGRLYRYYVSCVLAQGRREDAGTVRRASAPDLERAVLDAVRDWHQEAEPVDHPDTAASPDALRSLLRRVILHPNRLEILVEQPGTGPATLSIPWARPAARPRRELVLPAGQTTLRPIRAETRARLVAGIARARRWIDMLVDGQARDLHEIAELEGLSERSVRMTVNLAFLSPALVRAALDGTLPAGAGVSQMCEVPMEWSGQMRVVGANSGQEIEGGARGAGLTD